MEVVGIIFDKDEFMSMIKLCLPNMYEKYEKKRNKAYKEYERKVNEAMDDILSEVFRNLDRLFRE